MKETNIKKKQNKLPLGGWISSFTSPKTTEIDWKPGKTEGVSVKSRDIKEGEKKEEKKKERNQRNTEAKLRRFRPFADTVSLKLQPGQEGSTRKRKVSR